MTDKPYTDEQIQAAVVLDSLAATVATVPDGRLLRALKRLVVGLTVAVLVMGAAIVTLTAVVASRSNDAQVAVSVADCRSRFANHLADLREAKFDASMDIIKEEGRVIIETAAVHPPAPFDPSPIFKALAASDKASADYDAALAQRNDWVKAGEPADCPIKADVAGG